MPIFTNEKWHVVDDNGYLYVNAGAKDVCWVWSENKYDARLIVAAPDMYNLLKSMTSRTCNNCRDFKQQARDLLRAIDAKG